MFDQIMPVIYSSAHTRHAPTVEFWNGRLVAYPEVPQRVENIKDSLAAVEVTTLIEPQELIARDEITKVHHPDMINYLEEMSNQVDAFLANKENFYDVEEFLPDQAYFNPTVFPIRPAMSRIRESANGHHGYYCFDMEAPIGTGTWAAMVHAATLAYVGAHLVLNQEAKYAYALCRPPGHHAGPDFFGGYCYLNNAAIAANQLLAVGPVAIIDFDYHHGNGTQTIFWDEPQVFFGSIHAHPDEEYPYYSGYTDEIGGPNARGTNANFPLRRKSSEDEYLQAFQHLLARVADFEPSSIVVSAGFDAFEHDPVAFFNVGYESYQRIGSAIAALGLPVLLVQEGGYNVGALGKLAETLVRGILGR